MASSSRKAPASVPPQVPKRSSSKRGREEKEKEYEYLRFQVEDAKKKIKPSRSSDAKFWTSAAEASELSVKLHETEIHLSIQKWKEEDGGNDTKDWWTTPEAHRIVDRVKASHYEKVQYQKQAEQIEQGGPLRRAFQELFTTSQIGLGISMVGVGKRTKSLQSKFKSNLISSYGAATTNPKKPKVVLSVHDSATGHERLKSEVTAAHIVPHSLGENMLVLIFGANVKGELDTPYNGLLLHPEVEKAMDDGAIAIVPNMPDDPSTQEVAIWEGTEPKDYKWRIIDPEAEVLDEPLEVATGESPNILTIRGLEGRKLSFKNDMRPRAQYLYFQFVVAQLRIAWRHEYRQDPSKVLAKQLGRGFWATKGRYLKRSFLLAMADKVGHDTKFAENIPMEPGDDNDPDDTGIIGIAQLLQLRKEGDEDEEDEEGEGDEEDE
ncbi:hypothetical protein F4779DRAFT_222149 [Xylariaceae sp. FL0662B]|nr:hypothetical protein F4779DRAFT_222149 [Xylariaceae sp. FL0662B]